MRPRALGEIVGQEHLLGPGRVLRTAIETGELHSMILCGPPGSGNTTLASLMAHVTGARFVAFSAVLSGVKEIREVIAEADRERGRHGARTILFVDEIHRFNRAQQDAFLPHVEKGTIVLVGATTENPSFEVNSALLSRCRVYVLRGLEEADLLAIMRRALADGERGLAQLHPEATPEALRSIPVVAHGHAPGGRNRRPGRPPPPPGGEGGDRFPGRSGGRAAPPPGPPLRGGGAKANPGYRPPKGGKGGRPPAPRRAGAAAHPQRPHASHEGPR